MVKIELKTVDGNAIELPLLSVPLICKPLLAQLISTCKTSYKHLALLDFANIDDGKSELPVDILTTIGKLLLARLCKEKVVRLPLKPTLDRYCQVPPVALTDILNVITAHTLKIDAQEVKTAWI